MRNLTRIVPLLAASAVAVLVLATHGQARSSEVVTCSSTAKRPNGVDLTGTWQAGNLTYSIRQEGTCVWWAGLNAGAENAFFGTVSTSGKTVFGLWADLPTSGRNGKGSLILTVSKSGTLLRRRGSTGGFSATAWTKQSP
jgi:hypothetical protein